MLQPERDGGELRSVLGDLGLKHRLGDDGRVLRQTSG